MRRGEGRGANFGWRPFEGRARYTPGESAPGHDRGRSSCARTPTATARSPAASSCATARCRPARPLRVRRLLQRPVESARLTPGRARGVRNTSLKVSSLSSFGEDAQGRVYVVSLEGPVYRIVPR